MAAPVADLKMGLLIADPRPGGGVTWRLTDVPHGSRRPGGAMPSSEAQL